MGRRCMCADGVELSGRYFKGLGVEKFGHHVDASGVAYEDYIVGELVGTEVEVEHRAVGVDDEF